MKFFSYWAVLIAVFISAQPALTAGNAVEYTVDLSKSDNLKTFFDAGLRPWRLPGLEDRNCELRNVGLKIVLSEDASFHLQAETVSISVLAENKLDRIDITCISKPAKDAANDIRQICKDIQVSAEGLDDFVSGKRGLAWGGIKTINKQLSVQVRLQSVPSLSGFSAMLTMTMVWNTPHETLKFLTDPIQPPPGYENVSMDPPPRKPAQRQLPEHNAQYYQEKLQQDLAGSSSVSASLSDNSNATSAPSPRPDTNSPSTATESAANPNSQLTPEIGWWVLLGVLALLLAVYALKRNK